MSVRLELGYISTTSPGLDMTTRVEREQFIRQLSPVKFAVGVSKSFVKSLTFSENKLERIREIEWGKTYKWDVFIPSAPSPYDSWFPASEVTPVVGPSVQYWVFEGGQRHYRIPEYVNPETFRMVFYDDEQSTLEDWLRRWMHEVYNIEFDYKGNFLGENGVGLVGEISRLIFYNKLDSYNRKVESRELLVFPSGEPISINNSESGIRSIDIMFEVVKSKILKINKSSLY